MKDTRYYSLDFWRGVACLMVVAFHSSFYLLDNEKITEPGGIGRLFYAALNHAWVGVPMFFVISGYCITAACMNLREKGFKPGRYFYRRVKRIFPPYWVAVAVSLLFCGGLVVFGVEYLLFDEIHPLKTPESLSLSQWIGNISLTEIWRSNLWGSDNTRFFLGVAWTLCYEEQFYIVCGLLMMLGGHQYFRNCLVLSLLIAPHLVYRWSLGEDFVPNGFFFDGRWLEYWFGILLYYRVQVLPVDSQLARKKVIELLMLAVACAVFLVWKVQKAQMQEELFVSAAFTVLLMLLFRFDRRIFAGVAWRPIWVAGTMCYSLYLTHTFVVKTVSHLLYDAGLEGVWVTVLVTVPICGCCAFGLGWLFHLWVERRFLNSRILSPKQILKHPAGGGQSAATVPCRDEEPLL